ncbi:MAG: deoxyribodipyrimidine photolyase [Phycisphaerales bacterium]|nr:deoxyribodipyrimidine photolyase [Phycisphaerales bacterium]
MTKPPHESPDLRAGRARDGINLVWLKRDLRLGDHWPLARAHDAGLAIGLYVFEPSVWSAPDASRGQFDFVVQCLRELRAGWTRLGGTLLVRVGEMPAVLDELDHHLRASLGQGVAGMWSHEETGNAVTYARDIRVGQWCRDRGLRWTEIPQNGVFRRLKSRDGWATRWQRRMDEPQAAIPQRIHSPLLPPQIEHGDIPSAAALRIAGAPMPEAKVGGEYAAREELESFLDHRGLNYQRDMSSPVAAFAGCSRLSPYLAWGAMSIRHVSQRLDAHSAALRDQSRGEPSQRPDRRWLASLRSFSARLRWHCHFMQKLESEPQIEHRNVNRAFDGLREDSWNTKQSQVRFEAWTSGRTGYPMVDACMRALHAGGWINFRMRAMLASFSSYHLWLHWREPSVYLARQFIDYEPGIHYPQFQMQSGVTGINTVRIYSPAKQVLDHDPTGIFIRRYVPELANVPEEFLAEPHTMPLLTQHMARCVIGVDYPAPIVDHATAYAHAQAAIFARRGAASARAESRRVFETHGSRKRRAGS